MALQLKEGPPVEQCIGVGDRKHCFLVNSGSRLCIGCNGICCTSCSKIQLLSMLSNDKLRSYDNPTKMLKSQSDWNQLVASAEKRSFCCDTINNNRKPRTRRVEEAASTTVTLNNTPCKRQCQSIGNVITPVTTAKSCSTKKSRTKKEPLTRKKESLMRKKKENKYEKKATRKKEPSTKKKKDVKKYDKKAKRYCCRIGCDVNDANTPTTHFHRIPSEPKPLSENATKQRYIEWEGTKLLRAETLDRCHFKRNVEGGHYYVCEEHEFEFVTKTKQLKWKGESFCYTYKLYVPKGEGSRSTMCLKTADSRGLGEARQHLVEMEKVNEHIARAQPGERIIPSQKKIAELAAYAAALAEHNANPSSCWTPCPIKAQQLVEFAVDLSTYAAQQAAEAAQARKVIQQMAAVQCSSEKESIVPITPSLARAVGVDVETRQSPPVHTPNKRFFNCSVQRASKNPPKEYAAHKPPTVTLGISDDEVKRRTGFRTKGAMLGYIFLICNGDIAVIQERHSSLTWFEEWFLSLEWTWGRTLTRWVDVAAEANYGVKEEKCRLFTARSLLWQGGQLHHGLGFALMMKMFG